MLWLIRLKFLFFVCSSRLMMVLCGVLEVGSVGSISSGRFGKCCVSYLCF